MPERSNGAGKSNRIISRSQTEGWERGWNMQKFFDSIENFASEVK